METRDIILWSVSITLAVFGILFGVLAFWFSSKTSKQIKELISMSWITEESSRYFYDDLKEIIINNKKVLRALKSPNISYQKYASISLPTRMKPIAKRISEILYESEFKDITTMYIQTKKQLDESFKKTIQDISILSSEKKINITNRKSLTHYHNELSNLVTLIVKGYSDLAVK